MWAGVCRDIFLEMCIYAERKTGKSIIKGVGEQTERH